MPDKVALVSGASSGIGLDTARDLLKKGFLVYGAARRVDRMQPLLESGGRALQLDICKDEDIVAAVAQIEREEGRLDVLVNNAGYGSYGPLEEVPQDEARRQFDVNIFGLARLTQEVLPLMRKQKSGRIINISSMGGVIVTPLGNWYHATKFALEGLSDTMRLELAQFGIEVIVIQPGAIATEWGGIAAEGMKPYAENGAYTDFTRKVIKLFAAETQGSPTSVVSQAICHAATARKPKTRYAIGKFAKSYIRMRRLLSDRAYNQMILRVLARF